MGEEQFKSNPNEWDIRSGGNQEFDIDTLSNIIFSLTNYSMYKEETDKLDQLLASSPDWRQRAAYVVRLKNSGDIEQAKESADLFVKLFRSSKEV